MSLNDQTNAVEVDEVYSITDADQFEIECPWWRFHCRSLVLTKSAAMRFPKISDAVLRSWDRQLAVHSQVIKQLFRDFWQRSGMTPKEIKKLPKGHPLRRQLQDFENHIMEFKHRRDRVIDCLHARHLLRTQVAYINDMARVLMSIGKEIRLAAKNEDGGNVKSGVV